MWAVRARMTRSPQCGHCLVQSEAVGVVDCRRHQPTTPQRDRPADMDGLRQLGGTIDPESIELRYVAKGQRDGLQEECPRQQAALYVASIVLLRQPLHRAPEVDGQR